MWHELTAGLWSGAAVARVAVRLVVAMLLGAVVGYERERAGQWAIGRATPNARPRDLG